MQRRAIELLSKLNEKRAVAGFVMTDRTVKGICKFVCSRPVGVDDVPIKQTILTIVADSMVEDGAEKEFFFPERIGMLCALMAKYDTAASNPEHFAREMSRRVQCCGLGSVHACSSGAAELLVGLAAISRGRGDMFAVSKMFLEYLHLERPHAGKAMLLFTEAAVRLRLSYDVARHIEVAEQTLQRCYKMCISNILDRRNRPDPQFIPRLLALAGRNPRVLLPSLIAAADAAQPDFSYYHLISIACEEGVLYRMRSGKPLTNFLAVLVRDAAPLGPKSVTKRFKNTVGFKILLDNNRYKDAILMLAFFFKIDVIPVHFLKDVVEMLKAGLWGSDEDTCPAMLLHHVNLLVVLSRHNEHPFPSIFLDILNTLTPYHTEFVSLPARHRHALFTYACLRGYAHRKDTHIGDQFFSTLLFKIAADFSWLKDIVLGEENTVFDNAIEAVHCSAALRYKNPTKNALPRLFFSFVVSKLRRTSSAEVLAALEVVISEIATWVATEWTHLNTQETPEQWRTVWSLWDGAELSALRHALAFCDVFCTLQPKAISHLRSALHAMIRYLPQEEQSRFKEHMPQVSHRQRVAQGSSVAEQVSLSCAAFHIVLCSGAEDVTRRSHSVGVLSGAPIFMDI